MRDVIDRLRAANPVPRDLSTGWSDSVDGVEARDEVAWDTAEDRRRRRPWAAAVAAVLVLGLVIAVGLVQSGGEETTTPARPSTIERLVRGRWTSLPDLPVGMTSATPIWTGRELIVWGSDRGADLVDGQWRMLPDWGLGDRSGAIVRWTGEEMIVWGGFDPSAFSVVPPADGGAYDPRTRTWRRIAIAPVSPTADTTVTWTGRELIALVPAPDAWPRSDPDATLRAASYDPRRDTWRELRNVPRSAALGSMLDSVWDGRRVFVAMTTSEGRVAFGYDPGTLRWSRFTSPPSTPPGFSDLFPFDGSVVQIRSLATSTGAFLQAARLDGRFWSLTHRPSASECPDARAAPVPGGAVVTCFDQLDVRAYSADADRWYRLPDLPSGAWTTAWAGREFVVTSGRRVLQLF